MSTSGIGSTSWLTSFDPTDSSSLSSLLNPSPTDPSQSTTPAGYDVLFPSTTASSSASGGTAVGSASPAGFDVLFPSGATSAATSSSGSTSSSTSSSGISPYQQAVQAITQTADTFLVQSALGQPAAATSSDDLSAAFDADEQQYVNDQNAQTQATINAVQAAFAAGQSNIDTTA